MLLLSVPLCLEYEAVLTRPRQLTESGITEAEVCTLLDALAAVAEPVDISFSWRPVLSDPNDEMVLEAAVNGGADRLLTLNISDFANAAAFGVMVSRPAAALPDLRRL